MATSIANPPSELDKLDPDHHHSFFIPAKKINEGYNVSDFLKSMAYRDIMTFLLQLNRSMFPSELNGSVITWATNSPYLAPCGIILDLQGLLKKLHVFIDEVPLDTGPRRFGNISFRTWSKRLEDNADELLALHLSQISRRFKSSSEFNAFTELKAYLLGSFGSSQRLDYGTGHELSFLAFLGGIWKLGGFGASENGGTERSIVLNIIEPCVKTVHRNTVWLDVS